LWSAVAKLTVKYIDSQQADAMLSHHDEHSVGHAMALIAKKKLFCSSCPTNGCIKENAGMCSICTFEHKEKAKM
jgi:hypothetical protein